MDSDCSGARGDQDVQDCTLPSLDQLPGSKPLPPQFAAFPPGGSLTQAAPPSYEDVVKGLVQAQTVGGYEPTAQTSERLQPPSVTLVQPRPAWDESRAVGWQPVVSEPIARPGAVRVGRPAEPRSGQYDQTQPAVNVNSSIEFAFIVFIGSLMCLSPISALLCGVPSVIFAVRSRRKEREGDSSGATQNSHRALCCAVANLLFSFLFCPGILLFVGAFYFVLW